MAHRCAFLTHLGVQGTNLETSRGNCIPRGQGGYPRKLQTNTRPGKIMEKAESAPAASESRASKWQMPINRILWKNRPFQTNLISSFSCIADVIAAGVMDGALCLHCNPGVQ